MKLATVRYKHDPTSSVVGYLIENKDDLKEYRTIIENQKDFHTLEKVLISLDISKDQLTTSISRIYLSGISSMLVSGDKVFINLNDRYCPIKGIIDIISVVKSEYIKQN